MTKRRGDGGYTLIELLLVIVVLSTLATIVVASVGGFKAEAEESGCQADRYMLRVDRGLLRTAPSERGTP